MEVDGKGTVDIRVSPGDEHPVEGIRAEVIALGGANGVGLRPALFARFAGVHMHDIGNTQNMVSLLRNGRIGQPSLPQRCPAVVGMLTVPDHGVIRHTQLGALVEKKTPAGGRIYRVTQDIAQDDEIFPILGRWEDNSGVLRSPQSWFGGSPALWGTYWSSDLTPWLRVQPTDGLEIQRIPLISMEDKKWLQRYGYPLD